MKSRVLTILFATLLCVCAFALTACNNGAATAGTTAGSGTGIVVTFLVDDTVFATQDWKAPALPATNPEKAGFTFDGWYFDKDTWQSPLNAETLASVSITQNTQVYAKFTATEDTTYRITYSMNGGQNNSSNPTTYTGSEKVTLKNPSRTGYTFNGWFNGTKQVAEIAAGTTGNITLTAKWTANTYSVTFAANGGTGTMSAKTFTYDTKANLPKSTYTKTNSIFGGWKDSTGKIYTDGQEILNLTATGGGKITLTAVWRNNHGIDISKWQAGIQLADIKNSIGFVILRGSYTSESDGVTVKKDPYFEDYYAQAKAAGIPVGVYHYSCANTRAKGEAEAKFLYENCLQGKQFEFPIYIDVEAADYHQQDKANTTAAIHGFCEYLQSKNIYVGIYANPTYFTNYINTQELVGKYEFWLARYNSSYSDSPVPAFNYSGAELGMWQYSDRQQYSGWSGGLDGNVVFKDYETIIKSLGKNGFTATGTTPPTTPTKSVEEIAQEVIAGKWGTGEERKNALEAAGYNYAEVQAAVNAILNSTT